MPNIRTRSINKSASRNHHADNRALTLYAPILVAAVLLIAIWATACFEYDATLQHEAKAIQDICQRVEYIDQGMLQEQLSEQDIQEQIQLLEQQTRNVRGEIVDAVERFTHTLKDILANRSYDYPTLQILNYLDTYEHMELHVEGSRTLQNVKLECRLANRKWIGDEPAVKTHFSQASIEDGKYSIQEIIQHGETVFSASFNSLDGAGRPTLTGNSRFRDRREAPQNFNRISGPDANACSGCHNLPAIGGGGDNVANVFALSQRFEFVDFDNQMEFDFRSEIEKNIQRPYEDEEPLTLENVGNERNTVGIFGAGLVELLAREMTRELLQIEQQTIQEAKNSGWPVRKQLRAKGVDFGFITAHPNGFIYTSEVEGVDPDLIVRPFIQKGVTTSLREFSNDALTHHHGIQNYERTGPYIDDDGDGVVNEITPGDVTALVAFMATLPAPIPQQPQDPQIAEITQQGRHLFQEIGCATCHIPELPLESITFTEPNEFNVGKDLRPGAVDNLLSIDLSQYSKGLKRDENGNYLIPIFSDLRRHEMGETLDNEQVIQDGVPTDQWMTRRLWGFASEPPFLHHGRATLISEAILAHGGDAQPQRDRFSQLPQDQQEAIIAFLKTMTIPQNQ